MKRSQLEIKGLSKTHWALFILAVVLLLILSACKSAHVRREIEIEAWFIDDEDATLYRVVDDPQTGPHEEFIEIKGNPDSAQFVCWHQDQVKKWAEELTRKCK